MRSISRSAPVLCAVAASLALAACGASSYNSATTSGSSRSATQPATTTSPGANVAVVKTATNPTYGTILIDGQGMTLYALSGERAGKLICTSASGCLSVWHPLTVSSGAAPSGSVGALGTIRRPEGTVQVTYKGQPLYTFAQDHKAGETSGQGIKDVGTWSVVKVSGSGQQSSSGAASSSGSSGSGESGGYGY